MNTDPKLNIAVVGLAFGATFIPGFLHHPNVGHVGLCDVNPTTLREVGDRFGITRRHTDLRAVLDAPDYDAVVLFTAIPDHARQSIEVLQSGKHCACAVPMATTVDDLRAVIAARTAADRVYMMMETSLYRSEFLFLKDLYANGELGRIQFIRGNWYNSLENHSSYWHGIPPMYYITHPLSSLLSLVDDRVRRVSCFGSGTMRPELHGFYNNPHPVETAIFKLQTSAAAIEITSISIETAVQMKETVDVYGSHQSFIWSPFGGEPCGLIRLLPNLPDGTKGSPHMVFRMQTPTYEERLPRPVRPYRSPATFLDHEFITAILNNRPSPIDVQTAANFTAPGLCAHMSAMNDGTPVDVPQF